MANFWLYLPWTDDRGLLSGADMFEAWVERQMVRRGAVSAVSIIGQEHISEADPGVDDKLFICGHCGVGVDFIAGTEERNRLTAKQLAEQFKDDLPKGFRTIHIWACYSGDGMTKKQGLAYNFWLAMHALGFNALTVFGYRFAVLDPFDRTQADLLIGQDLPGFKSLTETPELLKMLPGTASNWMTGLDAAGKVIPPAPLPKPH